MLAPHIKKNVDKLWNLFWTAGITNPLVAVEQITYLLFLKRLEGIDNVRAKNGHPSIYTGTIKIGEREIEADQCRWSYIEQDKTPKHLIDTVFPWLRDLEKHFTASQASTNDIEAIGGRMSDAYFQLDPNKAAILQLAIDLINKLFARVDAQSAATDIMGDTFEYLLSEIATAGKNGQFRTPRHIIRCMVEMLDPQPGEHIIDPAAGTGGFLFSSLSHILAQHTDPELLRIEWDGTPHRNYGDQFTPEEFSAVHKGDYYVGFDNDRTMVRIGWMNMILHGIENPQIHQRDSLGKRRDDDPPHKSFGLRELRRGTGQSTFHRYGGCCRPGRGDLSQSGA
ncbi:N-6 DNA methylase [Nitrosomonas sp. Is37]|uniref:type I restriction-modification system subunit M n=1 Tax=Nitrosomonas sp. Is37 TaxID=3080535 RepID=UPI00294B604A|nr:N-6 DNA methylase [Nitrosomonas sp. Is37]MDV6345293.1 N-6 DNA methylase [Nitrosomonas sp. Is37]